MKIIFYSTNSPNNKIQKELKNALEKDIKLKIEGSILTPVLTIKSENFFDYNYCYIEKFKRYYYINDVEIYPNKIYILHLEVDVLMSFKEDILNSYALVNHNTDYNKYLNDNYLSLETKEVEKIEKKTDFVLVNTFVLSTIGGVVNSGN